MQIQPLALALASLLVPSVGADVHVLHASLDGAQVPVATPATGDAWVTVDDVTRYVHVQGTFSNLSAAITNVHLHGLAPAGSPGGVLIPLAFTAGTSGTYEGSATLSAANVAGVLDGLSYVNVHSAAHGGGEIRGQASYDPIIMAGALDGTQAATGSAGTGTYMATVDRNTNLVQIDGTYTGLSGNVTVAHLHGPAWLGVPGGVVFGLSQTGGSAGTFSGSATVTDTQLLDIVEGFTYVNIHSSTFGGGEIRGQVNTGTLGASYCQAVPNSTGAASFIVAFGSPRVTDNDVQLAVAGLPANAFGYMIASQSSNQSFPTGGSSGRLCIVGASVARFGATVQSSGVAGFFSAQIDVTNIPTNPATVIAPGDTWNFQAWHRDTSPSGATSNFSNAVSINFR